MRRQKRTIIVGAAILTCAGLLVTWRYHYHQREFASMTPARPTLVTLLFMQRDKNQIKINLVESGTRQTRVVYISASAPQSLNIPNEFGMLPSPDGAWVLVWEASRFDSYGLPTIARWTIVSVYHDMNIDLGETPLLSTRSVAVFPHWITATQLAFFGATGRVVNVTVDRHPQLTFPASIPRDDSKQARADFIKQFYPTEWDSFKKLLTEQAQQMDLHTASISDEDMLYWPLGLPRQDPTYLPIRYPEVTFSLNRYYVAVGDAWFHAPPLTVNNNGVTITNTFAGSRIEVYEVNTGKVVWAQREPPKAREFTEEEKQRRRNPPLLPWVNMAFVNPRWSQDNRYLCYTEYSYAEVPAIVVRDTQTWQEVYRIERASNAFILPTQTKGR